MKKSKGITLVALVITVILMLIISGVALSAITANESLFKKANIAKEQANKQSAKEGLSILLLNIKLQIVSDENRDTTVTDCNKLEGKKYVENIE